MALTRMDGEAIINHYYSSEKKNIMEERKTTNEQLTEQQRNTAGQESNEHQQTSSDNEQGISAERLSELTRNASDRAGASGVTTKRFITGDDADGQL